MCAGGKRCEGFPLLVKTAGRRSGPSQRAIVSDGSHLKPLEWNTGLSNCMDAYDRGVTESVLSFTAGGN